MIEEFDKLFDKQFNILFKENRKWFLQKDRQKWKGCIEVSEKELAALEKQLIERPRKGESIEQREVRLGTRLVGCLDVESVRIYQNN